ncbi:MAG: hypothetical protein QOD74_1884 [Variibacter sp.]|jgi:hypothetical protein|nr:hypothetical protein [Variibacter sp.]
MAHADEQQVASHTLTMLQGMRRELAAVLENQARDRELLHRVQAAVDNIQVDVRAIRADVASLDIKAVTHKNEILEVMRRLDLAGAPIQED